MRTIYRLANISASAPRLAMNLLQTLFVNLKDDALAFLAGVWISCILKNGDADLLASVGLHHAAAFLEAHIAEDDGMDFQTILPAFLVALQSQDVEVRKTALTCISCLRRLADRRFTAVYRFDTIYGQCKSEYDSRSSVAVHLMMRTSFWQTSCNTLIEKTLKDILMLLGNKPTISHLTSSMSGSSTSSI